MSGPRISDDDRVTGRQPVAVRHDRDGTVLYRIVGAPQHLPAIRPRDLADAWDAARVAALDEDWGPARLFRFVSDDGWFDLALVDADACCWTQAVTRAHGHDDARGVSTCLRLLGLIHLLADAAWARPLFSVGRDGTRLSPALLDAVARLPLTASARLDGDAVRAACAPALSTGTRPGTITRPQSGVRA